MTGTHLRLTEATRAPRRSALMVVGMHRSGTSALTRVLNLSGADLPRDLLGEIDGDNPLGFWESRELVAIHERLLASAGSSWDDSARFPASWFDSDVASRFRRDVVELLERDFDASSLFVLKDPRICRLVPFWVEALDRFGARAAFVIIVRNPVEVAASLKKRNGFSQPKSFLLWLQHLLAAERSTRGLARSFLTYDQLLVDWRAAIGRFQSETGVVLPRRSPAAGVEIDDFLRDSLRHHRSSPEELEGRDEVSDWVVRAYRWALRASAGESAPPEELEVVHRAYREGDRAFSPLIARAERDRLESVEQAEALERELARRLTELRELGERLADLEAESAGWRRRQKRGEAELESVREQLREGVALVASLRVEQRERLARREKEIRRLNAELAALDDHLVAAADAAESREAELEGLTALARKQKVEIDRLERVGQAADERAERLEGDVEAQRSRLAVQAVEAEVARSLVESRERELALAKVREDGLVRDLGTAASELQAVKRSLSWRLLAPLRWLGARLSRRPSSDR